MAVSDTCTTWLIQLAVAVAVAGLTLIHGSACVSWGDHMESMISLDKKYLPSTLSTTFAVCFRNTQIYSMGDGARDLMLIKVDSWWWGIWCSLSATPPGFFKVFVIDNQVISRESCISLDVLHALPTAHDDLVDVPSLPVLTVPLPDDIYEVSEIVCSDE